MCQGTGYLVPSQKNIDGLSFKDTYLQDFLFFPSPLLLAIEVPALPWRPCSKKSPVQNQTLVLGDTQTVKKITFSELYINKRLYKNIQVLQQKKRLLGSKFLKRFDKVFWDSKNLTVYMWNENDEY